MLLLFGAVCSVPLVLAEFGRTPVWTGQRHIFATLPYKRRAPSWLKLKPEDLKEQIGKLAEKSMTPSFVDVTLRDGFVVPQVKLVTGIKFLRILKKEGLDPSIPEILYLLVKEAKSMRKHLDKVPQGQRFEVPSHPRWEPHSPSCAVLPTRQVLSCQLKERLCDGLDWDL